MEEIVPKKRSTMSRMNTIRFLAQALAKHVERQPSKEFLEVARDRTVAKPREVYTITQKSEGSCYPMTATLTIELYRRK